MRKRPVLLSLSILAFIAAQASAEGLNLESVYRLLLKVATAPAHVGYEGVVRTVFAGGGRSRTVVVQIEHWTNGRDRVVIVQPPEDAGRVFFHDTRRDGGPHDGPLTLGLTGERDRIEGDLGLLLSNYSLKAVDGGRVAGRMTYRIDISPRYPDRKSKQLWVDRKTGIVLKSVVTHPVGNGVVTTEFTRVRLMPDSWSPSTSSNQQLVLPQEEAGTVSTGGEWIGVVNKTELANLTAIAKRVGFVLLSPHFLPTGFVMEEVREFPAPTNSRSRVVHILYSDGLSSISLFLQQEEPFWPDRVRSFFFGGPRPGPPDHRHPEEHGVAVVEGAQNGTRYVLVSDVATEILKQMADSLSPVKGAGKE